MCEKQTAAASSGAAASGFGGKAHYTYMVRCADGTLYTGWTTRLTERIAAHNSGRGAKYTRPRRPVVLIYYEISASKEEGMSREWQIKHLTRRGKEALIGSADHQDSAGIPFRVNSLPREEDDRKELRLSGGSDRTGAE